MANQRLNIDIVAKDKSKQALSNVQKGLSRLKQSVFNLKNAFIGLGAGLVVKGFIDAGIQVENLSVQLKTLFGSAQEGEKALRSITKFAATTPFELKNIQQGVTSLAVVRKQAEEAGLSFDDLLTLTGNVAAQMGGDFAFASFQIQKAFSTGIAAAESLKERGVAGMAGFKAGVSVNALDTIKIMNKAFGKGGEFGNLMEELSKTLFGTISNLKDAFFIFQVEVSKGFFDALKSNLGDLKKTVEENKKEITEFGLMIGSGLSKAINGTAKFLKFLKDNIDAIVVAFRIFIALKIVSFFYNLSVAIGVANGAMLGFNATIRKNLLIGAAVATISSLDIIIAKLKEAAEFMGLINKKQPKPDNEKGNNDADLVKKFAKMETLSEAIDRNFKDVFTSFKDANETVIKDMQGKLTMIGQTIGKGLSGGIKNFSDAFAKSVILGEKLSESFKKMAQQLGVKILSALIEILARKSVELAIEKLITREKQKQASLSLGSNLMGLGSLKGFFGGGRASGGSVQKGQPYMVGEQGAELFIPNQSGQIQQNARGGNGGATTVNFNINTVDASGFEELLVRSRGTITQLINNAVNERGSKNLI